MLDLGINVALGTDGSRPATQPISSRRSAWRPHPQTGHARLREVDLRWKCFAWRRWAALAAPDGAEVGSLEAAQADIILLDRDSWGLIPLSDPVRHLAFSVTSEAVKTSIVAGRVVMQDRKILTFDEAKMRARVRAAAERFRRDRVPAMEAGARRLEPYIREMYYRAVSRHCRSAGATPPAVISQMA